MLLCFAVQPTLFSVRLDYTHRFKSACGAVLTRHRTKYNQYLFALSLSRSPSATVQRTKGEHDDDDDEDEEGEKKKKREKYSLMFIYSSFLSLSHCVCVHHNRSIACMQSTMTMLTSDHIHINQSWLFTRRRCRRSLAEPRQIMLSHTQTHTHTHEQNV